MPRIKSLRDALALKEAEHHREAVMRAGCDHEAVRLSNGVVVMTGCPRCLGYA